ncbi:MAG: hypothetical protein ACLTMP_11725 [Eggerthella lenta]
MLNPFDRYNGFVKTEDGDFGRTLFWRSGIYYALNSCRSGTDPTAA